MRLTVLPMRVCSGSVACNTHTQTHAQKFAWSALHLVSWWQQQQATTTTTRELATLLAVLCRRRRRSRSLSHPLAVFAFGQLLINLPHRARLPANSFERILFLCCCAQQQQQQQRQRWQHQPDSAKKIKCPSHLPGQMIFHQRAAAARALCKLI